MVNDARYLEESQMSRKGMLRTKQIQIVYSHNRVPVWLQIQNTTELVAVGCRVKFAQRKTKIFAWLEALPGCCIQMHGLMNADLQTTDASSSRDFCFVTWKKLTVKLRSKLSHWHQGTPRTKHMNWTLPTKPSELTQQLNDWIKSMSENVASLFVLTRPLSSITSRLCADANLITAACMLQAEAYSLHLLFQVLKNVP